MMKNFSDLLRLSHEFEKKAQTNHQDIYEGPMASNKATSEVARINKLISKIKGDLGVFVNAVSLSDEDQVYGEPKDRAEAEQRKTKITKLIDQLSGAGRQWVRDINTYGVNIKGSDKYKTYIENIIAGIKLIPAPRGDEHKKLLFELSHAIWDFNPSMMYKAPNVKKPLAPVQQYQEYEDIPRPNYTLLPPGEKS